MNTEHFEAFCIAQRAQQSRHGMEVPPASPPSFANHQWQSVAKRKFEVLKIVNDSPVKKRGRHQSTKAAQHSDEADGCPETLIAKRLLTTIKEDQFSENASMALKHARREPFPMPSSSGGRAYLTTSEVALRLHLSFPENASLSNIAARMRQNIHTLQTQGIVAFELGKYPSLNLLMDLCSFDVLMQRWDSVKARDRVTVIHSALTVCQVVESSSSEMFLAELKSVEKNEWQMDCEKMRECLKAMSASIPFEFPEACRPALVQSLGVKYVDPDGLLVFPDEDEESDTSSVATIDSGEVILVESESCADAKLGANTVQDVGAPLTQATTGYRMATQQAVAANVAPPPSHRPSTPTEATPNPPLKLATATVIAASHRRIPTAAGRALVSPTHRAATTNALIASPAVQRPLVGGVYQCTSKYHVRYSQAAKHASAECSFCSTCHLMEVLFNDYRRDCFWKHWPTPRKVKLHIKGNADVARLALQRLEQLQRGELPRGISSIPL